MPTGVCRVVVPSADDENELITIESEDVGDVMAKASRCVREQMARALANGPDACDAWIKRLSDAGTLAQIEKLPRLMDA